MSTCCITDLSSYLNADVSDSKGLIKMIDEEGRTMGAPKSRGSPDRCETRTPAALGWPRCSPSLVMGWLSEAQSGLQAASQVHLYCKC